ncbi:MAG TPA: hypothetical protein VKX31_02800 [Brumimicrobium sp.]|nr:hypothetical protein [Brumimicrobium sp.]
MKKIKKVLILLFIFNFSGCNPKNCGDIPKSFDVIGLELTVKKKLETYSDGSFSTQSLDTNETVKYSDLVIEIVPQVNYYGQKNNSFHFGNFFIPTAYAGKCPSPGFQGSSEQISDLLIFSNQPFLSSGNTTDTLSHFFEISGWGHQSEGIKPKDLLTFIATQPYAMQKIKLTLKTKPTGSDAHQFTILYQQTNGEEYELTTPNLQLD